VTKRSRPSAPPSRVFLGAPWKRPVLCRPEGGKCTRAQGPSWQTPATPAMRGRVCFLNAKEEVVHAHWGERRLL
jgi:hypothetical protein